MRAAPAVLPFRRFSIGIVPLARLIGYVGLFGMLLIVLATATLAWAERSRQLRDAQAQAASTAYFLADHAHRLFEVADVALAATATALGDRSWTELAAAQDLREQMRRVSDTLPYIEDLWLNDDTGRLRLTSLSPETPAGDASDRPSFRAAMQPDAQLIVGDIIVGRVTRRATFLITRRLEWPDHRFRGTVSATADLAYFSDYWRKLALPFDARVALRLTNGNLLAPYPPDPPRDDGPDAVIRATQKLADLPLALSVEFRRDAVLVQWHGWLARAVAIAAAALLVLGGLIWLTARQTLREAAASRAVLEARRQLAATNAGLEATVARRTAELQRTSEEVQRFAYMVSHDLRAPLVNVLGFTGEIEELGRELLDASPSPDRRAELAGEFAEAIGFVRAGTSKMDRLLNHILRLSRDGKRTLHPEPIDMTALIHTLADALRFQADAADTTIAVATLPPLTADRLAVEQVFGNLLDNAVKYPMPGRPGRISVAGEVDGAECRYTVADNGRGIAPEDHGRVFDLFRRAGKQDRDGEGIGLAHVATLVRAMGGRIEMSSALEEGTRFEVVLPSK